MNDVCVCVCLLSGNTYDRRHIVNWLHTHSSDPLSGLAMDSKKLVPNLVLRSGVAEWRVKMGGATTASSGSSSEDGDFDEQRGGGGREERGVNVKGSAKPTSKRRRRAAAKKKTGQK